MLRKVLLAGLCAAAIAGLAQGAQGATRSILYVANSQGDDITIIDLGHPEGDQDTESRVRSSMASAPRPMDGAPLPPSNPSTASR